MFISQIMLDTKKHKTAKALYNRQLMHSALENCFTGSRQHPLWRVECEGDKTKLLVLSKDIPDFTSFMAQFGEKDYSPMTKEYNAFLDSICKPDIVVRFKIVANPTIKHNGKRVPLNENRTVKQPYCALDWIKERLSHYGGNPLKCTLDEYKINVICKNNERKGKIAMAEFSGFLRITDPIKLKTALTYGIGHGKAYGCGLLSIAKII